MEKLITNLDPNLGATLREQLGDNFQKIQNGVDGQSDSLNKQILDMLGDVPLQDKDEVTQARVDSSGKAYSTLKGRLDSQQSSADTALREERAIGLEVEDARSDSSGETFDDLKSRLDSQESKIDNRIDNKLAQISSVPETFTNLAALKNAYPNGRTGIFVTADTGHKYIWANNSWNDAGVYQSVGIADHVITNTQMSFNSIQGNLVLSGGSVDYDTTNNVMTIVGNASSYVEFGNQKFAFGGKQIVTNSGDKTTRFRLVYDTALGAFSSLGWQDDISSNLISIGTVYISTDASGTFYYNDNFKFEVTYNGKQPGSAELITRAHIATNGMVPNINTAQKSINWTIFIQLIKQHLRYDYYYKN